MLFAGRPLRHHTQDQYARSLAATTSLVAEDIGHEIADHARALSQAAATLRATPMQAAALRANLERRAVLDGMFNEGVVVTNRRGEIITQLPVSTPSGSILTHGASVEQFANLGDAAPLLWIDTESRSGSALLVLGALLEDASGAVVGSLLGLTDLTRPSFIRSVTVRGRRRFAHHFGQGLACFSWLRRSLLPIAARSVGCSRRSTRTVSCNRHGLQYVVNLRHRGGGVRPQGLSISTYC